MLRPRQTDSACRPGRELSSDVPSPFLPDVPSSIAVNSTSGTRGRPMSPLHERRGSYDFGLKTTILAILHYPIARLTTRLAGRTPAQSLAAAISTAIVGRVHTQYSLSPSVSSPHPISTGPETWLTFFNPSGAHPVCRLQWAIRAGTSEAANRRTRACDLQQVLKSLLERKHSSGCQCQPVLPSRASVARSVDCAVTPPVPFTAPRQLQ